MVANEIQILFQLRISQNYPKLKSHEKTEFSTMRSIIVVPHASCTTIIKFVVLGTIENYIFDGFLFIFSYFGIVLIKTN